ncbi:MAG: hypothetical protein QF645_10640, partial [Planctomycetota bacterium]|nr:hypothetical protein [Planctomycetota bacterium]
VYSLEHPNFITKIRSSSPPNLVAGPQWIQTSHSFRMQLENFARAIQGEEAVLVDGKSASRSIYWFDQMYQKRSPLEEPWLQPSPPLDTA